MLNTGKLAGKTLYITGASRGIGKAIALKAAKDGAKIAIAAKTSEPHPKLPGTIYTAAQEIESAGGRALPLIVDVRDEAAVQQSIDATVQAFGGIDILVNNASAISLTGTQETSMKKFDLMHQINTRGTYLVSRCALPYLKASKNNPHILNLAPPLNMNPRWFRDHVAYTMAKYGMSMCVLGMAEEFRPDRIAVNALWPKTAIITAAMEMLGGSGVASQCRTVDIMADAAYVILTRDAKNFTGNFVVDEAILREEGCRDFDQYAVDPKGSLMPDFFLDDVDGPEAILEKASGDSKPRFVGGRDTANAIGGGGSGGVQGVFDRIGEALSAELVEKTKAIYSFNVSGSEAGKWFVDLKNGSGSVGIGEPASPADCTFSMKDADFHDMFSGKLKPTAAFMTGKMKLDGNMGKAMALDQVMTKMHQQSRSYHSCAAVRRSTTTMNSSGSNGHRLLLWTENVVDSDSSRRSYGDASGRLYNSVPEVFDRIKSVASEEIVQKVQAIYVFDVAEEGKYFVDFKNGAGSVGKGDPEQKPDVTITMNQDNCLKVFNRELTPATGFMTGKIKVSGDLSKALTLEAVMKAAREAADAKK